MANNSSATNVVYVINLYSLSSATNPLTVYDISGFTPKRTTKFSAPITGQATAFLTAFAEGGNTWDKFSDFNPFNVSFIGF